MWRIWSKLTWLTILFFGFISSTLAWDKGIYLTQYMIEKPDKLDYFIRESKETGINTFVIDHEYYSSRFAPAIAKIKAAGLKSVVRIVVFTDGGNAKQIRDQSHWEKKLAFAEDAIKAGVDAVQLDYIRYSSKQPANPEHAKDVYKIIKWFKSKIGAHNVPMEIDIFGEVSYYPSMHIGQDIKMFADSVDGVNPMVYPSHFWPYQKYSADPYNTIRNSLNALVRQFDNNPPFKVHAFIEAANYHYLKKTTNEEKQRYLLQEIRGVEDANAVSGWYVWSANNVYDNLFKLLRTAKTRPADFTKGEPVKNQVRTKTPKVEALSGMDKISDKAIAVINIVKAKSLKVDFATVETKAIAAIVYAIEKQAKMVAKTENSKVEAKG